MQSGRLCSLGIGPLLGLRRAQALQRQAQQSAGSQEKMDCRRSPRASWEEGIGVSLRR